MLKNLWEKVKDFFEPDITAEIKERVTNPFYVSLAIAWSVWNWRLVYIFFNFDDSYTLNDKQVKIQKYLDAHDYWGSLALYPIITAFCAIIILTTLVQIALFITVFSKRRIQPLIYKIVGHRDDIVDARTHLEIKKRLYGLQDSYKSMQQEKSNVEVQLASLRTENQTEKNVVADLKSKVFTNDIELTHFRNKHTLELAFPDRWNCYYIMENGSSGEEPIEIKKDIYLAHDIPKFKIDMVDIEGSKIRFRKTGITDSDKRKLITELDILDDKEYNGTENDLILVRFEKQGGAKSLDFIPYYKDCNISLGDKTQIVFRFKNNVNRTINILSYTFSAKYMGKHYKTFEEHRDYNKELSSLSEVKEEFDLVDPLQNYFENRRAYGIYDSEITIKYRLKGETTYQEMTRTARLVVGRRLKASVTTL